MRILLASPDPWNHPLPYHIAPQRIARALTRARHILFNLDIYDDPYSSSGLPPNHPNRVFPTKWGLSLHTEKKRYFEWLQTITDWFKPDLVYLFGWQNYDGVMKFLNERGVAIGLHRADPYWFAPDGKVVYPAKGAIQNFRKASYFTTNEGQAWNYLRQHGLEDKVHLLSHAIDPALAPSLEILHKTEKKFMCSTVMGGEDPYRREDLVRCYYQATNAFPEQTFVCGGGLWKSLKWRLNKEGEKQPYDAKDEECFNLTKIYDFDCETFPEKQNPAVLCHKFIHQLYSRSYYGFTPWGEYLRTGPQSEYNVRTFGTKTTEMGGSGAAMLSCRIQNIDEIVTEGKTGFVVDSVKDSENAFQYAVDNPKAVKKMGEAAWKDIHKRHSWDVRYREVLLPIFRDLGLI